MKLPPNSDSSLYICLSLSSFLSFSFFFFFLFLFFFLFFLLAGRERTPHLAAPLSGFTFRSHSRKLQMTRRCHLIHDCNQDVVIKYNFSNRVVDALNRLNSILLIQAQLTLLSINWINICLVGVRIDQQIFALAAVIISSIYNIVIILLAALC